LGRCALQPVELCLDVQGEDAAQQVLLRRSALWENPFISSPYERRRQFLASPMRTEQERQLATKRLSALGHVE
jgi:hypothetical protein